MKISVLIPSRGRPHLLKKVILSLLETSIDRQIEFLLRLDTDDCCLVEYESVIETLKDDHKAYFRHIMTSERVSYKGIHYMYNDMASKASGDWLMVFNDDALMELPHWDAKIYSYNHQVPVLLSFYSMDNMNLFPVISRKLYELQGHLSLSAHIDSWLESICRELGIMHSISSNGINHFRDQLNDQTRLDSQSYYSETSSRFHSEELKQLRDIDRNKIKDWLNEQSQSSSR